MDQLFNLLGQIVLIGGGASLVIYNVFKFLAAKWLDERFKKNFQQLVHDQNKEIERLKSELTKSFDRASKLHQREFEALPRIWEKVASAYWTTAGFVSPAQMYPDLNRMVPQQLEEFVQASELTEWQRDELMASNDKTKKFQELIFWHKLARCRNLVREADFELSRVGIFVIDPVKQKLQAILDLSYGALTEHEMNHEHPPVRPSDRLKDDISRMRADGREWVDEAERMIKTRIWEN